MTMRPGGKSAMLRHPFTRSGVDEVQPTANHVPEESGSAKSTSVIAID